MLKWWVGCGTKLYTGLDSQLRGDTLEELSNRTSHLKTICYKASTDAAMKTGFQSKITHAPKEGTRTTPQDGQLFPSTT